jgi:hypothetical protein
VAKKSPSSACGSLTEAPPRGARRGKYYKLPTKVTNAQHTEELKKCYGAMHKHTIWSYRTRLRVQHADARADGSTRPVTGLIDDQCDRDSGLEPSRYVQKQKPY